MAGYQSDRECHGDRSLNIQGLLRFPDGNAGVEEKKRSEALFLKMGRRFFQWNSGGRTNIFLKMKNIINI